MMWNTAEVLIPRNYTISDSVWKQRMGATSSIMQMGEFVDVPKL